jgi:hypothetical protein
MFKYLWLGALIPFLALAPDSSHAVSTHASDPLSLWQVPSASDLVPQASQEGQPDLSPKLAADVYTSMLISSADVASVVEDSAASWDAAASLLGYDLTTANPAAGLVVPVPDATHPDAVELQFTSSFLSQRSNGVLWR